MAYQKKFKIETGKNISSYTNPYSINNLTIYLNYYEKYLKLKKKKQQCKLKKT